MSGHNSKYFSTTKLKEELNSQYKILSVICHFYDSDLLSFIRVDAEVGDHDKTCFGQKHRDQLLLEFKDYATEVDVDFVREGCSYESIIATLCESVDTLDEPEAKAFMIWIIGDMQKESTLDFLAASNMFFTEAKKCSVGQPGVNMCSQDSNP
ncbi:hypothetical protein F2Q68_00029894 [Brassica cretica]|uniref:Uncharacterized protein n=1 Tax=Brassica cretica TaxID=69181 RepID=A0A8S9G914_BRACR|nr:hypothetical protein F2Q68_00029894 [Brassica cretica]